MALLHMQRGTLTHSVSSCSDEDVAAEAAAEQGTDTPPPPAHGLEVVGVQGRVQAMVLRFSVTANGSSKCNTYCLLLFRQLGLRRNFGVALLRLVFE